MACRLALMSWERGHRTMVLAESDKSAGELDAMMWESPLKRFLPHARGNDSSGGAAPVVISLMDRLDEASLNEADLVINLCPQPVVNPNRFGRLLEIVPQQQDARRASRDKFKYYREQGITPGSHEINK